MQTFHGPRVTVRIDDTEYRLVRDGLEYRIVSADDKHPGPRDWTSIDTDRDPDAYEQTAFEMLEMAARDIDATISN